MATWSLGLPKRWFQRETTGKAVEVPQSYSQGGSLMITLLRGYRGATPQDQEGYIHLGLTA